MINGNEKSDAQSWELEIACKNKKYLDAVVNAVLRYGTISFEVENIEWWWTAGKDTGDGRWTVLMWCVGLNTLKSVAKDLAKIEKQLN